MRRMLQIANLGASPRVCDLRDDIRHARLHLARMSDEPLNHLRAWREHREMTQAELAEAVGTTAAVISLLESGARGLSDKWLRRLAPALKTRPGILLDYAPEQLDTAMMECWAPLPEPQKPLAVRLLREMARPTGTDG